MSHGTPKTLCIDAGNRFKNDNHLVRCDYCNVVRGRLLSFELIDDKYMCPYCKTTPGRLVCIMDDCINTAETKTKRCPVHTCRGCGEGPGNCPPNCPSRKCTRCKDPITVERGLCPKCKCEKCESESPTYRLCDSCGLCPHCRERHVVDGKSSCEQCRCSGDLTGRWVVCTGDREAGIPCPSCKCKTPGCQQDEVPRSEEYCTECKKKPCVIPGCVKCSIQPTSLCSDHASCTKCEEKTCDAYLPCASDGNTLRRRCQSHLCKKCTRAIDGKDGDCCVSCKCEGGPCEDGECTTHCNNPSCIFPRIHVLIEQKNTGPCIKCACWICLGQIGFYQEMATSVHQKFGQEQPVISRWGIEIMLLKSEYKSAVLEAKCQQYDSNVFYTCKSCENKYFNFITKDELHKLCKTSHVVGVPPWMDA